MAKKSKVKLHATNEAIAKSVLQDLRANGVRIVKSKPLVKARATSPGIARGWRFINAWERHRQHDKVAAIVESAVIKAESQAIIADSKVRIAKSQAKTAEARERTREALIKANDIKTEAMRNQAQLTRHVAEIADRVEIVRSNYERAAEQVAKSRDRQIERAQQRLDIASHEWIVRAQATTDPDLRLAYLANAREMIGALDDE